MNRRTRDDRRQAVIEAAAAQVWAGATSWSASITFDSLEAVSGVDRSQITKDFGSKDGVIEAVVEHLLAADARDHLDEHVEFVAARINAGRTSMSEVCEDWATTNQNLQHSRMDQLRAEMLTWASGQPGSRAWQSLGDAQRTVVDTPIEVLERMTQALVDAGATRRDDLTIEELSLVLTLVIEGIMIRSTTCPSLVSENLLARVTKLLAIGVVGPDEHNPTAQAEAISF